MRAVDHLIEAAQAARRACRDDVAGARDVEIVVTEVGLVVRGKDLGRALDRHASEEIAWPEFDHNPGLLVSTVHLIVDRLERAS